MNIVTNSSPAVEWMAKQEWKSALVVPIFCAIPKPEVAKSTIEESILYIIEWTGSDRLALEHLVSTHSNYMQTHNLLFPSSAHQLHSSFWFVISRYLKWAIVHVYELGRVTFGVPLSTMLNGFLLRRSYRADRRMRKHCCQDYAIIDFGFYRPGPST